MSHYRVFVSRLLHTSTEGKEPRKGRTGFGKTGLFMYSRRKKHTFFILLLQTDVPHKLWGWKIQTQQSRETGLVGWGGVWVSAAQREGWPDDFPAAP